ncbi:DEAD/DEAH box helicase [Pelistega sp. NLN82]|uniref:DEAD/DEAH box helicase n=1 Tax=Pelistega ratti TaxID=2652177 RepID=A0A6L9Y3N6_9BURK|nr:DEAD/DEAH box helicase [Pelistega ratti]NEN74816.1 DEAD/DEAH box helicase [Pelistega ratti]
MSFDTLGLAPVLLNAIKKAGFTQPTPVQSAAIPMALNGHDLIVTAQTGSGKTAAFMLPALQKIATQTPSKDKKASVQMLVLTPTRELALQVAEAAKIYSAGIKDLRIATVVGGMPYGAQIKALSRRVDILVATPGRLIDHLQAKRVNLSKIHSLVLDEADRMLDMGFIDDIDRIVAQTPKNRQTLMFSATFEGSIVRLAQEMLNDPQRISIADQKDKHTNIKQCLLYADDLGHKFRLLDYLLRDARLEQAIVFTATKRGADDLAERLEDAGFAAAALHGDMNQRQRTRTLNFLQKGRIQVLVATDVAARGIDIQGITHSINYDLPMQAEDYVHRIGRTGRAGRDGLAFTLATHSERFKVRRIEKFIGQTIETDTIPGLEPTPKPIKTKESKSRHKADSRKNKSSREKELARDGFAHRKGLKTEKNSEKISKSTRTKAITTHQENFFEESNPFQASRPTTTSRTKRIKEERTPHHTLEGDFEILSASEARQLKKQLGKAPKFADYERGARSSKAKYNRETKRTRTSRDEPKRGKRTTAEANRAETRKKVSRSHKRKAR